MSTYILYRGIKHCGGNVSTQIPDRVKDGYGINENLIDQAKETKWIPFLRAITEFFAISEIAHAKNWDDRVSDRSPRDSTIQRRTGKSSSLAATPRCNRESKKLARNVRILLKSYVGGSRMESLCPGIVWKMGFALEETYEFLEKCRICNRWRCHGSDRRKPHFGWKRG